MKENKVITNIEQLTPEWLTSIFKNKGYLSKGKVSAIISRNSQEALSSKIVIKKPKPNTVSFKELSMFKHEVNFYNLVAGSLNEMLIPTCYDATVSEENSFNEKEIFNWFENESRTVNRMLESLGDRKSNKRKELFKTVFSLYPQLAWERLTKKNITIINCDAHFWNFFYLKDIENGKSRAKLFDWEGWVLGVGTIDLAFMIGLFWYPERRHLMEEDLVKRYHNQLLNLGVRNYDWDDFWYDYRFSALNNLYDVVWWWNNGSSTVLWWDALERAFLTLEDLNCMEFLES